MNKLIKVDSYELYRLTFIYELYTLTFFEMFLNTFMQTYMETFLHTFLQTYLKRLYKRIYKRIYKRLYKRIYKHLYKSIYKRLRISICVHTLYLHRQARYFGDILVWILSHFAFHIIIYTSISCLCSLHISSYRSLCTNFHCKYQSNFHFKHKL